jgi:hypothetical protein
VLGPVVEQGFAEDWKALQADVYSRVGDKNPQLVEISYYAGGRDRAKDTAEAVATSLEDYVARTWRSSDGAFLESQLEALQSDIADTTERLAAARRDLRSAPADEAAAARSRVADLDAILNEQRSGYADLKAFDGTDAGTLTRVDEAWTVRSPLRPTPLVLAVAGAAAALVIAVGWLHVFGRLRGEPPTPIAAPAPQPHGPTALRDLRAHRSDRNARVSPWAGPETLRPQPEQHTRASER